MDAKSKANFIISVASGSSIPCPKCGASNSPDDRFCLSCGAELAAPQQPQAGAPAFRPAREAAVNKTPTYVEPSHVFAQGLPDWSIEPPQVMVRRR